jgi:hypothetical protein
MIGMAALATGAWVFWLELFSHDKIKASSKNQMIMG